MRTQIALDVEQLASFCFLSVKELLRLYFPALLEKPVESLGINKESKSNRTRLGFSNESRAVSTTGNWERMQPVVDNQTHKTSKLLTEAVSKRMIYFLNQLCYFIKSAVQRAIQKKAKCGLPSCKRSKPCKKIL